MKRLSFSGPFCIACALALFHVSVGAQQWKNEPSSFFGIPIGEPFPAGLPQCGGDRNSLDTNSDPACFYRTLPESSYVVLVPDTGVAFRVVVETINGRAARITATARRFDFPKIINLLANRFGKPSEQNTDTLITGDGSRYTYKAQGWLGHRVNILALERYRHIDNAAVVVYSKALGHEIEQQEQDDLTRAASKF
jgi:hypothetical protein